MINDFDDDINTISGGGSSLTGPSPPTPQVLSLSVKNWYPLTQTCTPIACTWTYPIDTPYKKTKGCSLLRDKTPIEQREKMCADIDKWLSRCNKVLLKKEILRLEVYFELTKQGLIHGHGLLYYDDVGMYNGFYLLIATAWARISGGSVKAMSKYNPINGRTDYAFDKCNNVENWKKYIRKECPPNIDYKEDTSELAQKIAKRKKKQQDNLRYLDEGIEVDFE